MGLDIIVISSDEDEPMDNLSLTPVFDLQLSSEDEEEDEEINLMARCVQMEMSGPLPIPGPSHVARTKEEVVTAGLPNYEMRTMPITPRPMFDPSLFSLGKGNRHISRDDRLRVGHPITLCRISVPLAGTPMSPPPQDRGPAHGLCSTMYCDAHGYQQQRPQQNLDVITEHFQGMEIAGTNSLSGYSDCVICGKSVEHTIKDEAVIDYMHKTAILNESPPEFNARRMAFLEGMEIGTFLLLPGACDSNFYTIDASRQSALPGTLPLQQNFQIIDDNFGPLRNGICAVCNTCKYSGYFVCLIFDSKLH